MAFRLALRRGPSAFSPASASFAARRFHATPRAFVKVGESIPDVEVLQEGSPGNKVNLAREFEAANGVIVGVPAAFSGACSEKHIPSYIQSPKLRDAGRVFVVSVNDAFV